MNKEKQLIDDEVINPVSNREKLEHVNASAIYNKGILSIIFCLMPTIIGIMFVNQCMDLVREARKDFSQNPGKYEESSIRKVRAGRTMAFIGLGFFVGEIVVLIAYMTLAT